MKIAHLNPAETPRSTEDERSWAGESYKIAALVCMIGFFMRLLLSEQVLNILGLSYGGDNGSLFGKIHPGSYLIIVSFFILLCERGNAIQNLARIAREQTAFFTLFALYVILILYWLIRGPKGVGMLLDTHIVMPICAIVFSYAPRAWCRKAVLFYAGFAVLNSAVGLFESATHVRVFPYDSDWEVLQEEYFRASAFLGHPLANAVFTAVSIFIVLNLRMRWLLRGSVTLIMLASLVAFGGRAALVCTVMGLIALGIIEGRKNLFSGQMTVMRTGVALLALVLVPTVCLGLLYGILNSSIGERLMANSTMQDDSTHVRALAFRVFHYMTSEDMLFGMDGDRITAIGYRVGVAPPMSDIENPWILMLMYLGAIMFTLWLGALALFLGKLMKGASPALKIAVIEYFAISSTSNSFGRKDVGYMLVAGIVVCAKRMREIRMLGPETSR